MDPRPVVQITRRQFLESTAALAVSVGVSSHAVSLPRQADTLTIENDLISASWTTTGGTLRAREIVDREANGRLALPEQLFSLTLADGARLDSTQMHIVGTPVSEKVAAAAHAARLAERY